MRFLNDISFLPVLTARYINLHDMKMFQYFFIYLDNSKDILILRCSLSGDQ